MKLTAKQIHQALISGKAVRRAEWGIHYLLKLNEYDEIEMRCSKYLLYPKLTAEDIVADDWEVVK